MQSKRKPYGLFYALYHIFFSVFILAGGAGRYFKYESSLKYRNYGVYFLVTLLLPVLLSILIYLKVSVFHKMEFSLAVKGCLDFFTVFAAFLVYQRSFFVAESGVAFGICICSTVGDLVTWRKDRLMLSNSDREKPG